VNLWQFPQIPPREKRKKRGRRKEREREASREKERRKRKAEGFLARVRRSCSGQLEEKERVGELLLLV